MEKMLKKLSIFASVLFFSACSAAPTRIMPARDELEIEDKDIIETEAEMLEKVEVRLLNRYMEYSDKETDPLKFVKIDREDVSVTTDDRIDLSIVGDQEITYILHFHDTEREVTKTFTVKDTKAPEIKLDQQSLTIEYGESFDPYANIKSVSDPVDGDLERTDTGTGYRIEGHYDVQQAGTYELKVIAADRNGNESTDSFRLTVKEAPAPEPEPEPVVQASAPLHDYIGNANTYKFHYPWCSSVNQMKESNKQYFTDVSRDDMLAWGYDPCQRCNP